MSGLAGRAALASGIAGLLAAAAAAIVGATVGDALWVAVTVLAMGAAAFVGAYLLLRPVALSVRETAEAARALRGSSLSARAVRTTGPTAQLTHEFNVMATEIEASSRAITAEHARLEAALAAAADGIMAVDATTDVQYANPAALALLGMEESEVVGRTLIESVRDYEFDALVREALAGESVPQPRVVPFGRDRTPLRALAVPVAEGGSWAALLVLVDLSDVQRVDHVRRDFISNVSHELRTPIAAIGALVETLELGDLEGDEQAAFLSRIRNQVERMALLTNELLDLSRIESGAIHLEPESVDLASSVAEAQAALASRLEACDVRVEGPDGATPSVEADRTATVRIVTNLLDNALKFSPDGSVITIDVRDEDPLVAVEVCDDGPGIAAQDLDRVFERFYKAEHSRADDGAGLGLAIVKHLVQAHGGTVAARNEDGRGAAMTVRLPKRFVGREPHVQA
ncbi:MAG: PAS domain-containing protein [Dehalococcoidia bacterium]|nr:PAS domain-containing protein [Dehalococcoidia bacterium]MYD28693.1 PAS domain-containing protein [Dehalococcoidia bacterium]